MFVLPTSASRRRCHTEQNCLEIASRSIYNNQMHKRDGTLTGPIQGHQLLLVAAAILALMTSGAKAELQSAKGDRLPVAPSLSDSGSSTSKQSVSANKPSTTWKKKRVRANAWTNTPPVSSYSAPYWNPFGIDDSAGLDPNGGSKKFRYTSPASGAASSFDKLKLGDSYLGVDTQRRLQTHVPSGKVDCATDEECEDYSAMPRAKSRGLVGTSASPSSPNLLHSRKPFFGLSVTTPIE